MDQFSNDSLQAVPEWAQTAQERQNIVSQQGQSELSSLPLTHRFPVRFQNTPVGSLSLDHRLLYNCVLFAFVAEGVGLWAICLLTLPDTVRG